MALQKSSQNLLQELVQQNFGKEVLESLENKFQLLLKGLAGSSKTLLIAELFIKQKRTILWILSDKELAHYSTSELEELVGKEEVFYYPEAMLEPYQNEKTQNANIVLRTEVLNIFHLSKKPKIIITTPRAISEKVLKKEDFKAISHHIAVGDKLDFDFFEELLHQFQFSRTDFVSQPGEFSIRGGIVDIFSYSHDRPYRITFFGSQIESIKEFDVETQLTTKKVDGFDLVSNMNFEVKCGRVSFLQLLAKNSLIVCDSASGIKRKLDEIISKAKEKYRTLGTEIKHQKPEELWVSGDEFSQQIQGFQRIQFWKETNEKFEQDLDKQKIKELQFHQQEQPSFHKNFELLLADIEEKLKNNYQIWISFSTDKQNERLREVMQEISGKNSQDITEKPFWKSFQSDSFHQGFIDLDLKIAVYTDHQIFDRYHRYKTKTAFAKSEQLTIKDLMSLKIGDYITHIDHGIGKFMGLVKVTNDGKTQECFKLIYKNNDILYVSVHALYKISKYNGPDGREITLNKLGSPAWKTLKQKTKSKVKQIAFDLIKLYAKRKTTKGFAFSPDSYLQTELEASFLYEDTPDQEKATADVKQDMEKDVVMDRLICGDVGFGKTEVAIRAAFKAATDGKQTAVLVPTTILAFQHYRSFSERLKDFPVTVSYLNRFRTANQKIEVKNGLKTGKIDIVIGTHQLVSKDIQFKDLGLLIIDEEHKFGVGVKDKLKTMKANVDTLTLTATPIPRTLQFSLMAARDLSVIKTPPPNRQPVETHLIGFDEEIIRDAISYELQRDGQVFFINNRIENLKEIAGLIQRLVPNARVITGHGQMDGKQLEENVLDFMEGKYDVLVSTTIVESGVDVPNANTIFINDAQKFGMADLHQMRGRVGRSNRKAFCYLITPPYDLITSDARKRLEAIEQFSDLGSGFQIAMKDLEIRGAGDLLGAEQSGFINEMGFEAYQKIMQEALEELQNDEEFANLFENEEDRKKLFHSIKEIQIDTDLELLLPDDYISSSEERLSLYQKLAELNQQKELEQFRSELVDRFGVLPIEAENLLKSMELKWLASDMGFEKIVIKRGVFLGYFPGNPQDKFYQTDTFQNILDFLRKNPNEVQLKEKLGKEGNQLMLRKDSVFTVEEVNQLLSTILEFKNI